MVNEVTLIGNLGGDPESHSFQSGAKVAKFSLATSESHKDKATGEWQQETQWHSIVAWGDLGDRAAQSLKKGETVYLKGKIVYEKYTDKEGVERRATKIVASYFRKIGGAKQVEGQQAQANGSHTTPAPANVDLSDRGSDKDATIPFDDDLPF